MSRKTGVGRWGYWVVAPVLGYAFLLILVALDEDMSGLAFTAAFLTALFNGFYAHRRRAFIWEAVAAGLWFPTLLAAGRVYWKLGMSSPASFPQSLCILLGWEYAPSTPALALGLAPAGLLGFSASVFDRWWLRKTGRPFFESEEDD